MKRLNLDQSYLMRTLFRLLEIPSPTGLTDTIVHVMCHELKKLGIPFELTRRGAIRANMPGKVQSPDRAIVAHLDTLGAMVKNLRANGRIEVVPVGTWSPRFAEGARVTVYMEDDRSYRGTILPLKASGHTYNEEIDTQPTAWSNLEVRVDMESNSRQDLEEAGFNVGDFIAIDPDPEFTDNGYIVSRHLDDKAGVAAILTAAKAIVEAKVPLELDCHLLFTISEEVGVGASHVLHGDVAELVSVDNGTLAPGQNTSEFGVTISMQDSSGPFDRHLTSKLIDLCRTHKIEHARDVFNHYRSDAAAAMEAGNDIRTALLCFGLDASHGYERTHIQSLMSLADLLSLYIQSPPTFTRDRDLLGPLADFPHQPELEKHMEDPPQT
ncbi:osmoprotectant NAGGN system M42 family peptidase [Nitrospina gracilis]|uniref:osmoprotectant NAGGN system M42 family peptidase n=1 Tax=Nitrospina gracilis TaxID=35801 RepID=UPI001F28023A|nr:osmoprotectant NAGGN system M42 family peptidase [Nitrospina gracilis]MCF8721662.1 peptidase M42 family hydrolase [Nitrospina gracilis Nb-211]